MTLEQVKRGVELAAQECIRNGLTSVHQALVRPVQLQAFRELIGEGRLPLRVYVMLDGADQTLVTQWLARGPEIDPRHQLTIRAFKLFADGALGSRGAALLQPLQRCSPNQVSDYNSRASCLPIDSYLSGKGISSLHACHW